MSANPLAMVVGICLSAGVCVPAWRMRALSSSGAIAAFVVGSLIMGLGGVAFAIPLVVFFVTSSLWSRWRTRGRHGNRSKGRDASQVIGNGGVATMIVLAALATPEDARPTTRDWYLLYLAALAFANADTWATEIGSKLSGSARMITDWRRVTSGTSGAISLIGSLAGLAGACVIAASAYAVWPAARDMLLWRIDAAEGLAVVWAGFMGALVDSFLGATVQAQYRCNRCERIVEEVRHCGAATARLRGVRWFGNGAVNFAGSLAAAACAWYLLRAFAWPI